MAAWTDADIKRLAEASPNAAAQLVAAGFLFDELDRKPPAAKKPEARTSTPTPRPPIWAVVLAFVVLTTVLILGLLCEGVGIILIAVGRHMRRFALRRREDA